MTFHRADLWEYTPSQWRKILFGNGRAPKQAALDLCAERSYSVQTHDEAEAVCIGLAHLKEIS